jgi:hypothetical protein
MDEFRSGRWRGGPAGADELGSRGALLEDGARVGGRGFAEEIRPGGFRGAVLGEEGGRGMYGPMGGYGRRRDDDEEHRVPDYLEELDDPWGNGADLTAVPPVIGEEH